MPGQQEAGRVTIEFRPHDKVTRVPAGMTLYNAANWIGLPIDSTCGGRGTCGKCKVRIEEQTPITAEDRKTFSSQELDDGWRLSCRLDVYSDLICEIPRLMSTPKAALMGSGRHVILDPNVHKLHLMLPPPSLADQRSDFARVRDAVDLEGFKVSASLPVLQSLPHVLRDSKWDVTAVIAGQDLIGVEAGDTTDTIYGLAFDIGTTTVAGILVDLVTGRTLAMQSALNEQAFYGADVIARISHVMTEPNGLAELFEKITDTLRQITLWLGREAGIETNQIYEAVMVGNTTMLHLLMRIDPQPIGVSPFIPTLDDEIQTAASEIRLPVHPQASVHLLPHAGAYVGADLISGMLATGIAQSEGLRVLIDVGTNGEIIIGSASRLVSTAAPAGPAFEGARIKDGMRASEGAIEGVIISRDGVSLDVIGDCAPIGICGSGLIDTVAQLRLAGLLDKSGRLCSPEQAANVVDPEVSKRVVIDEQGIRQFVLAWPHEAGQNKAVVITQKDIRELQSAKAAMATGIEVLLKELGASIGDLTEIDLAGAFGSYINPQSARIIGLVPPIAVEKIKAVGNAAGEGAKIALVSYRERQLAHTIWEMTEYFELSGRADFNDLFLAALSFPDLDTLNLSANSQHD